MKDIQKYIEHGIKINGNPKDGYTVFTVPTQHFNINSLDELTVETFEKAITEHTKLIKFENELLKLRNTGDNYQDVVWKDYINGNY